MLTPHRMRQSPVPASISDRVAAFGDVFPLSCRTPAQDGIVLDRERHSPEQGGRPAQVVPGLDA